ILIFSLWISFMVYQDRTAMCTPKDYQCCREGRFGRDYHDSCSQQCAPMEILLPILLSLPFYLLSFSPYPLKWKLYRLIAIHNSFEMKLKVGWDLFPSEGRTI